MPSRRPSRATPLFSGKTKDVYRGPEPRSLRIHFRDDATAFNKAKHTIIDGKGVLNNLISGCIFDHLRRIGIATHFLRNLNMREQIVREAEPLPVEVIVRNDAAGGLVKRLGLNDGDALPRAFVEFCHKSDDLSDPLVSEDCVEAMGWADGREIDEMISTAHRINDFLTGLFAGIGVRLADFKLEFGRAHDEEDYETLILIDEISPDTCRLRDLSTGKKMDKDRFREDLGGLTQAYQEIARRLGALRNDPNATSHATSHPPSNG